MNRPRCSDCQAPTRPRRLICGRCTARRKNADREHPTSQRPRLDVPFCVECQAAGFHRVGCEQREQVAQ